MDFKLSYDNLNSIFEFVHPNQLMIVSETCTTFNQLIQNKTFPKDSYLFSKIELLKWATKHNYRLNKSTMFRKAIKYGDTKVLQYLKDNIKNSYKHLQPKLYIHAIDKESIEILDWLVKSKCLYNHTIFDISAPSEIFSWVMTNCVWNSDQLYDVIETENIDKINWVIKSVPFLSNDVCDIASQCNSLRILKWAVQNNFKYGETTCSNAALNGNLKMIKFLRKNKCKWSTWTVADAASNGHNHIIKYCLKNNCPVDEYSCCEAALNNHLQTLKLLIEEYKCPVDDKTYSESFKNPDISEYLKTLT